MKLKALLKGIPKAIVKGSKEIEINGICSNSKCVAPGNLFIAKQGKISNGGAFISEAISGGAVAVLTDIYNPFLGKIVQIVHPDPASIEGAVAAQFYHYPSREMLMVGITGTNGKTTCSFLVKHLLDRLNLPCGLIGTIEYMIGEQRYPATHTTPDVITNQRLLREMVIQGCKAAVMEVSSHALDQNRVSHISFDAAIFTNLTLDHLDYHLTFENYANAKAKLFSSLELNIKKHLFPKAAIANKDSPWCERILKDCQVPIITYGMSEDAEVKASNVQLTKEFTRFDVSYRGETVRFDWGISGRYNISNCLAVTALGLSMNVSLENISEIISDFKPARGRLEKVPNELGLHIYVDYAHTDDALKNVLECLSEIKTGRLITVFGCGGNRDRSKRPLMGQIAQRLSDSVIVTSDNPRDEDPMTICQEVVAGLSSPSHYFIELDRASAIEKAIRMAQPGDMILIAGKGHESYQTFRNKTIEFDDLAVTANICKQQFPLKKNNQPPNGAKEYSPGEGSPDRGDASLGKKALARIADWQNG